MQLNDQFGIDNSVVFKEDPEGNVRVEILNSYATASIMMQGAHLISWVPKDEQPVIWLSREAKFSTGKSIRGGIPVCWPWFGPHDSESSFPAHGFARTIPWQIIETRQLENGYTQLVFQIVQSEQTQKSWPYPCELIMTFTIGAELKVELLTRNTGDTAFVIGEALHTYFAVSDASKISINGLDNCTYLDKLDNFQRKIQSGSIEIAEEVDRVYLDTSSTCIINDPGLKRKICINKTASDSTVVWNPWLETANKMGDLGENGHLEMVCVESANAADNVVTVKSGEDHLFTVNYAIEKMS
jgi:glucose-6-phosphate 1-epimerase